MRKRFLVLVVGALLLLGAQAQARGPFRVMQRVLLKVGLSPAQLEAVKKLHFAAEGERIEIRFKQDQAQLELEQALDAPQPDKQRIFLLIERVEKLDVEGKKNRLGLMLDIRALMSPEQWRKLEDMQNKRAERRQGRMAEDQPPDEP